MKLNDKGERITTQKKKITSLPDLLLSSFLTLRRNDDCSNSYISDITPII